MILQDVDWLLHSFLVSKGYITLIMNRYIVASYEARIKQADTMQKIELKKNKILKCWAWWNILIITHTFIILSYETPASLTKRPNLSLGKL